MVISAIVNVIKSSKIKRGLIGRHDYYYKVYLPDMTCLIVTIAMQNNSVDIGSDLSAFCGDMSCLFVTLTNLLLSK